MGIEELITKIRIRLAYAQSLIEIHAAYVVARNVSEETFFLCYQAARLMGD